jgi:DNA recombination protein RmuC
MVFVTLAVGLGVGAATGWALARARGAQDVADTATALARVTAELEGERRVAADRQAVLLEADTRLRDAFATASAEALRANSQSFLELAKASLGQFQKQATTDLEHRQESIGQIVKPVQESLARVDAKLAEVEQARTGSYATLIEQLKVLGTTTTNLERALRTPDVRGGWGEVQLRRVVEMAGMVNHCDFVEKRGATTDDGRFVPDLIIKLPGGRNIIVDAKVPYVAYREAVEAESDETRIAKLKAHARQLREHMTQLSSKRYWDQFQPAPEFVFMFLPGEGYFSAALQQDPALIEYGADKRVIPASPLTLIALLRAVSYGWQQETITRNAQEVSELGRELYDRVRRMGAHFDDLAKGLVRAVDAYNSTVGTLEARVLVTARRFTELGVTGREPIEELSPVDRTPRKLQAPEHSELFGDLVDPETVDVAEEDQS